MKSVYFRKAKKSTEGLSVLLTSQNSTELTSYLVSDELPVPYPPRVLPEPYVLPSSEKVSPFPQVQLLPLVPRSLASACARIVPFDFL